MMDMYGFPVPLYYQNNNNKKQSFFGAMLTIIVMMFAISYISILSNQFNNPQFQHVYENVYALSLEELAPWNLTHSQFNMFSVIRMHNMSRELPHDLDRYLSVSYVQLHEDWSTESIYTESN